MITITVIHTKRFPLPGSRFFSDLCDQNMICSTRVDWENLISSRNDWNPGSDRDDRKRWVLVLVDERILESDHVDQFTWLTTTWSIKKLGSQKILFELSVTPNFCIKTAGNGIINSMFIFKLLYIFKQKWFHSSEIASHVVIICTKFC